MQDVIESIRRFTIIRTAAEAVDKKKQRSSIHIPCKHVT